MEFEQKTRLRRLQGCELPCILGKTILELGGAKVDLSGGELKVTPSAEVVVIIGRGEAQRTKGSAREVEVYEEKEVTKKEETLGLKEGQFDIILLDRDTYEAIGRSQGESVYTYIKKGGIGSIGKGLQESTEHMDIVWAKVGEKTSERA